MRLTFLLASALLLAAGHAFAAAQATLTVTATPSDAGTVSPSSPTLVAIGHPIQISATPGTDYDFDYWEVVEGAATFADAHLSSTTVAVSDDTTLTANFRFVPKATLTLVVSPLGTGTTLPQGATVCVVGDPIAISASGEGAYVFANWSASANAEIDDPTSDATFVTLSGDATVTAHFSLYVIGVGGVNFSSSHTETGFGYHRKTVRDRASLGADINVDLTREAITTATPFQVVFDDGTFQLQKTLKDAGTTFRNTYGKGGSAQFVERDGKQRLVTSSLSWDRRKVRISITVSPPLDYSKRLNLLNLWGDIYRQGDERCQVPLEYSSVCAIVFGDYTWTSDSVDYKGMGTSIFFSTYLDDLVSWHVRGKGSLDQFQFNQ